MPRCSPVCLGRDDGWRPACWLSGAKTGPALRARPAFRHSQARRQCSSRAGHCAGCAVGVRRRVAGVTAWRQALDHFAWERVLCEPWAQASYKRQRAQGKTYALALRALAHQWVRIIYAMWQKRQPSQRATFTAAPQAHGGVVA